MTADSKTDAYAKEWIDFIFVQTPMTTLTTNLFISLHTADPSGGNQSTNEATYPGYNARIQLTRNSGSFDVTTTPAMMVLVSDIGDNNWTGTSGANQLITHWGIGATGPGTGAGNPGLLLYSGQLTPNITVTDGVTPIIASQGTSVSET